MTHQLPATTGVETHGVAVQVPSGLASLSSRTSVSSPSATSNDVSPSLRTPCARNAGSPDTGQPRAAERETRVGVVDAHGPDLPRAAHDGHDGEGADDDGGADEAGPVRLHRRVDLDAVRDAARGGDADAVDRPRHSSRVIPERWVDRPSASTQHDRLVERLGPRLVVEQRRRRGGVAEPRVQGRVAAERALERVVGAVVDHAHDAVVVRRR